MGSSHSFKNRVFTTFTIIQMAIAVATTEVLKNFLAIKSNNLLEFLVSLSLYVIVLISPTILYLKFIDKVSVLSYLKLKDNLASGVFKGIIISIFIFIIMLIKNRFYISRHIQLHEDAFVILGKLLVGFLEEVPFRGFYLQKFEEYMLFWKANLLSSLLFIAVHVPNFINGTSVDLYPLTVVFIVGLWMGFILKETKSLWCIAIIHSIYDLSIWLIL